MTLQSSTCESFLCWGQHLVRSVRKCKNGSRSDLEIFLSLCETLSCWISRKLLYVMRRILKNHPGARYSLEQIELVCKDKDAVCSASASIPIPFPTNRWWHVRKFVCTGWRKLREHHLSQTGMGASFQQDLPPKAFGFDSLMAVISPAVELYSRYF